MKIIAKGKLGWYFKTPTVPNPICTRAKLYWPLFIFQFNIHQWVSVLSMVGHNLDWLLMNLTSVRASPVNGWFGLHLFHVYLSKKCSCNDHWSGTEGKFRGRAKEVFSRKLWASKSFWSVGFSRDGLSAMGPTVSPLIKITSPTIFTPKKRIDNINALKQLLKIQVYRKFLKCIIFKCYFRVLEYYLIAT